jgi:hypothetical protein
MILGIVGWIFISGPAAARHLSFIIRAPLPIASPLTIVYNFSGGDYNGIV